MYESNFIILSGYAEYLVEIVFTVLLFTVAVKFIKSL